MEKESINAKERLQIKILRDFLKRARCLAGTAAFEQSSPMHSDASDGDLENETHYGVRKARPKIAKLSRDE